MSNTDESPNRALRYYPHHEPGNWCNEEGAKALRDKIAERWRGFAIKFALLPAGFTAQMRTSRYDLRSDMINGMPRELYKLRLKRASAA